MWTAVRPPDGISSARTDILFYFGVLHLLPTIFRLPSLLLRVFDTLRMPPKSNSLQIPQSSFSFSVPRSPGRDLRPRPPARLAPGFVATPQDGRLSPLRQQHRGDTDEADLESNYDPEKDSTSLDSDESDTSIRVIGGSSIAKVNGKQGRSSTQSVPKTAAPRSSVEHKKKARKASKKVLCLY